MATIAENIRRLREEIRGTPEKRSATSSIPTAQMARYKRLERDWVEAEAVGDPGTGDKEEWIRLRMHGGR